MNSTQYQRQTLNLPTFDTANQCYSSLSGDFKVPNLEEDLISINDTRKQSQPTHPT
jgi:hypothetical protein